MASASSAAASSITARAAWSGLGSEEMNALVGVGEGARHEPNLRATQVELYDGLTAVSARTAGRRSNFDVGAINNKCLALHPRRLLLQDLHVAAGASGSMSTSPSSAARRASARRREGRDPDTYEHIHVHCDVLVIGGGVAGLAAAEAAAATGAKVIIADENPHVRRPCRHLRRHASTCHRQLDWVRGEDSELSPRPRTCMC